MDLYGNGKLLPNLPVPPSLPPRPHSDPPPRRDSAISERRQSTPTTTRPPRPSLGSPATPRKNQDALGVPDPSQRGRTKSSTSSIAGAVTCSGTTKSGEPCKNTVKRPTALGRVDSDADKDIERYCHLHMKEVLKPSGFQSSVANEWVTYDDWIPAYLQEDTRAALRHEMNKPATSSDRDGYIYTFEIRDNNTPDDVHLKVGRTVNLVKRMDQWAKQCESKEQVLRGFWPGDGSADPSNLMKGRIKAGNPGKYCYRLERLVHLELADLMQNKPYLESGFPSQNTAPDRNPSPIERRKCPDCGKTHKEIFTFERFREGKNKGKEYQAIVEVVVEKWGRYVEKYVDGPIGS
ncbi:hypothetical protein PHLGIDRAFT_107476 [Phlebiopsis gigantea 11061_1 CR5-6]|uniref:Bacteriophage T5 Orf172 DNA-binding domain-containing protein n=1 Tax=Phlebiopsis gigantea (strain 11061_1 CR5-6) TaxID=745531 RepID=A0A0C3S654_PHLG1|nr:hypothetical protein PHLGIDRAFT_107476 [Phlebiopsis gigantea 11061_1 CR5-6]